MILICVSIYIYIMFVWLVLEKYSLKEFVPIVEGIRKGDLKSFTNGLHQYQDLFIR